MTDETQKLRRFKDAVYVEAEKKVNAIITQANLEKKEKIAKAEQSAEDYKLAEINSINKIQKQRFIREVSAARLEEKRKVLLHREQIVNKVFENVIKQLAQHRQSKEYGEELLKTALEAKALYANENGKILISADDQALVPMLKASTGYEVEAIPTILLGGVKVLFEDLNIVIDNTFDSLVEDEREKFCRTAELAIL